MKERILSYLEKNARIPHEDIATMLGISVDEVKKIVAECFAQVSYKNNRKLDKDLERLAAAPTDSVRYAFFHDKVFGEEESIAYKSKHPGINIVKLASLK